MRGVGKGTLVDAVLREFPDMGRLVAHTTRKPRPGEVEGVNYSFVSRKRFEEMCAAGQFMSRTDISAEQSTAMCGAEILRYQACVGDVSPRVALEIRGYVSQFGGEVYIIGVEAPTVQRKLRIQMREVGLSMRLVEKLLSEDPVTAEATRTTASAIVTNDEQGNPQKAVVEALRLIRAFLDQG